MRTQPDILDPSRRQQLPRGRGRWDCLPRDFLDRIRALKLLRNLPKPEREAAMEQELVAERERVMELALARVAAVETMEAAVQAVRGAALVPAAALAAEVVAVVAEVVVAAEVEVVELRLIQRRPQFQRVFRSRSRAPHPLHSRGLLRRMTWESLAIMFLETEHLPRRRAQRRLRVRDLWRAPPIVLPFPRLMRQEMFQLSRCRSV